MYDEYGCIVHRDVVSNAPYSREDACFHMGLQAMLYCMLAEKSESEGKTEKAKDCFDFAQQLWGRCLDANFIRHPIFENDANATSFDMMVIWDFVCSRWHIDEAGKWIIWWRPYFERRNSKYWSGRHRAPWMFWPVAVVAEGLVRLVYPPVMHRYFQGHVFMLKAATTLQNTGNWAVRWIMHRFTKRIEKITGAANPFFRWLSGLPQDAWPKWINWGQESTEWMFQRDFRLREHYKELYGDRIEFHKEELPDGLKLNMNAQFMRLLFWPSQI